MSNRGPFGAARGAIPTVPHGEAVASYETYREAQQAVDVLARADFPVDKVSIVGSDLKTVERVTGKLTWGRVALAGAASGAWLGVFFGLLLVIFSPVTNLGFIAAAVLIGAGFGMLFGLVSYGLTRRRRDYTSMTQVLASSYSVIVDPELANRARNLIAPDAAYAPHLVPPPAVPPAAPGHDANTPGAPQDQQESGKADGDAQAPKHREPPRYGEYSDDPPRPPDDERR